MDIIPVRNYIPTIEFHERFPILAQAVIETECATQAPTKLITHCAINAVFSSVQALADFKRPDGGCSALTNLSLIIGETGERKSTVDNCFFKGIYRFREECNLNEQITIDHRVRMKVWRIEGAALEKEAAKAFKKGDIAKQHSVEALKQHECARPRKPSPIVYLYQDTSLASLKYGLSDYPAACVHSTEGMSILTGALFKDQALLCQLFSGETYLHDRVGVHVELKERRLCVSAHSQPKRTYAFLRKVGEDYRDSGLAARMTPCIVNNSTQGYRTYDHTQVTMEARDRFQERVQQLMNMTREAWNAGSLVRREIKLSPDAARYYLDYANQIEREIQPHGKFHGLRDYANRLSDKIGRLAAALHLFEGFEGDISTTTLIAAISFYDEVTQDYMYLFNYLPSDQHAAEQLLEWMRMRRVRRGEPGIRRSEILQFGMRRHRNAADRDAALALLERRHQIHIVTHLGVLYVVMGRKPGYGSFQVGCEVWNQASY